MRTWIKGGILVAAIYLLIQLIDDFCYVFLRVTPFEKVRYLLYFDFIDLYSPLMLQCSGWFEACAILYILALGFIIGIIIGGIVGLFNKEDIRREILRQNKIIEDGKLREVLRRRDALRQKHTVHENKQKEEGEKKREEEEKRRREEARKKEEEEVPEIEIIPLEKSQKKLAKKKVKDKRKNKRK